MIVNICVWDAQFSTDCRNPDLLWPLNSLAHSFASLHCLFSFTFCHLSFVISQYVHGYSLHRLFLSLTSTVKFMAGMLTCTHKHMSATQKPYLASREFFPLCYLERVQRYKAELCHLRAALLAVRIEKEQVLGMMQHFDFCTLHFNSNHRAKVVMDKCNETTTNRHEGSKKNFFYEF